MEREKGKGSGFEFLVCGGLASKREVVSAGKARETRDGAKRERGREEEDGIRRCRGGCWSFLACVEPESKRVVVV